MEQSSLFDNPSIEPLASRMRPKSLEEFVGQKHLLGEGKILRKNLVNNNLCEEDDINNNNNKKGNNNNSMNNGSNNDIKK